MARKLRIAVSEFFGVLTLLLCVLWVRSYWRMDWITLHFGNNFLAATSLTGAIVFSADYQDAPGREIKLCSRPVPADDMGRYNSLTFYCNSDINMDVVVVPHWFFGIIVGAIMLGAAYVFSHFSLRTLFVATTLVALVLGLAVWTGR